MKNIVVTGAAGFIGSNLVRRLNSDGYTKIILVDKFDDPGKNKNLKGLGYAEKIDRDIFIEWLSENSRGIDFIFHLGARTDTGEFNFRVLDSLNLSYSKSLWEICTVKQIPLVYASSAATYGMGEHGFRDDHALLKKLKPLNPYGLSKHLFDLFVIEQHATPPFWCGLKFFNVYGPNEFHKGRMASVVFHAYNQIRQTGKVRLFQSHHPNYKNGEQLRDFIYVDDVIDICVYFLSGLNKPFSANNGIYNVGTAKARTFNDLARAIFSECHLPVNIEYIPTPEDIRDKYQYYTEAVMDKLRLAGYSKNFTDLEGGLSRYLSFLKSK